MSFQFSFHGQSVRLTPTLSFFERDTTFLAKVQIKSIRKSGPGEKPKSESGNGEWVEDQDTVFVDTLDSIFDVGVL